MTEAYDLGDGLVVTDDGEILACADQDDPLAFIVRKRDMAKAMQDEWEKYRKALDTVILRKQTDKRLVYGDLVSDIKGRTYTTTDAGLFAEYLYEHPLELETIFEIIAAAKDFKRDLLPEAARKAYDDATTTHQSKPWVETSKVRQPAPRVRKVEMVEA